MKHQSCLSRPLFLHLLSGALAAFVGICFPACDSGNGPNGDGCDDLCSAAGYGQVDEISTADGTLTCECKGQGNPLTQSACAAYCEDMGGEADTAETADNTCTCPMAIDI